jgi:DedD protein
MAEPADLNLDELRRRGRRRLIGAIVLALVAAVVVPMLLESDPRPLGEDVSVRIPPVDDGKFVNQLTRPKPEPAKEPAPASATPAAPAPAPAVAPPAPAPATEAVPRKSVADAEKSVVSPPPKALPKAAEPPKAADAAKAAPAKAPETAAEPPREGFVVQLAAFSDDKGANALAN